jgi:hypothetical protein
MTDVPTGQFTGKPIEEELLKRICQRRADMEAMDGDRYDLTTAEPSTVAFIVEPTRTRVLAPRLGLDAEILLEDGSGLIDALRQAVALHAVPFVMERLPEDERERILAAMQEDRPA